MLDDLELESLERMKSGRVVGKQAKFAHTKLMQDLRSRSVVSNIRNEIALPDATSPGRTLLRRFTIAKQLIGEADSAHLLLEVQNYSATFSLNLPKREQQLRPVIILKTTKNVAED